jgi:hypothetical protein
MAYFKHFRKIGYDVRGAEDQFELDAVTNILQRVRLRLDGVKYNAFFGQHIIHDGETPEYLAYEYYGDSELHWLILYAHQATNPYYDWPLKYHDLQKFISKKYGVSKVFDPHHYEDDEGYQVDEKYFDKDSMSWVLTPGTIIVTNFQYEEKLNDDKRTLSIVRQEYVGTIVKEFKLLLK